MNFKDSFEKDMEHIKPDVDFVRDLSEKMKKASAEQSKVSQFSEKKKQTYKYLISAAAVLILLVSGITAITYFNGNGSSNKQKPLEQQGMTDALTPTGENIFNTEKWYTNCDTETEIYGLFVKRITDDEDLTKIYESDESVFDESMLMNTEEIQTLIQKLENGNVDDSKEHGLENLASIHYMAVFQNGDIIKFTVYENSYLKFNELKFEIFLN